MKDTNKIGFQLLFNCSCGESDAKKFILTKHKKNENLIILCGTCERKYEIFINSRQLE